MIEVKGSLNQSLRSVDESGTCSASLSCSNDNSPNFSKCKLISKRVSMPLSRYPLNDKPIVVVSRQFPKNHVTEWPTNLGTVVLVDRSPVPFAFSTPRSLHNWNPHPSQVSERSEGNNPSQFRGAERMKEEGARTRGSRLLLGSLGYTMSHPIVQGDAKEFLHVWIPCLHPTH